VVLRPFSPTRAWRPAVVAPLARTLGLRKYSMRSIALPAIQLYQRHISPYKGFCCAYRVHLGHASCSTLGYRAIRRYGFVGGLSVLKKRLALCGVAYRRHGPATRSQQRGSAPCDLPCDGTCVPDCDLPDLNCSKANRFVSCCDACSCDWPNRKKAEKSEEEKYVYLPPKVGKP
jgi:uncharacterized protein